MQNLYIILFIYLLFIQYSLNKEIKLRECPMHKLNDCPEYSECNEINASTGECQCIENYIYNKNYNVDKIYCIQNPNAKPIISTTEINNASNLPKSSKTAAVINSSENESIDDSHHHVLGGILIPIFIILFIILTAYGIKRLEIIRRFREHQLRRRRQRPFYEDVMMSQDTNDDPPLI